MDATLELPHERVNDVPLLLGFLIKLQLPEIGHSKAHRPALSQFKLMAAITKPVGLFLAGDALFQYAKEE